MSRSGPSAAVACEWPPASLRPGRCRKQDRNAGPCRRTAPGCPVAISRKTAASDANSPASAHRCQANRGGRRSSQGSSAAPAQASWLSVHLMWGWLTDRECFGGSTDKCADRIRMQKGPRTGVRSPELSRLGPRQSRLFRLADRDLQGADAVDAAFDLVAGRERRDPGRCPRQDDIAGAERDLLRQLGDDLGHAPDQFGEIALLPFGAVDRKPDLSL